ncbi:hypothetical protein H6787_02730 [Candidatus Nomurabacteria bacterium]|nr:hypothetical protein [Candidatus Nomurabacteria bacterium]
MTQSELNQLYKSIATDFKLATRKTELWELNYCYDILHDVKKFILFDYATAVSLMLLDNNQTTLKAKKYQLGTAVQQASDRPGSIEWEDGEGNVLTVVVSNTDRYLNLSHEQKLAFYDELRIPTWGPSSLDANFYGLPSQTAKRYTSGNSGVVRTDFN